MNYVIIIESVLLVGLLIRLWAALEIIKNLRTEFSEELKDEREVHQKAEQNWSKAFQDYMQKCSLQMDTLTRIEHEAAQVKARADLASWRLDTEAEIRADAIHRSLSVNKGKITEHLLPYFPDFEFNPKDARFMGSPVDLIVFDGMSDGKPTKIVFIEVKTGSSTLTTRERAIRDLIKDGKIEWKQIVVPTGVPNGN